MKALEVISFITAFQLLQLSAVLFFTKRGKLVSNHILATYMLFNALLILFYSILPVSFRSIRIDSSFYFLLAPYLFLYVRSLCQPGFKRSWKELGHWIPAMGSLILSVMGLGLEFWIQILLELQIAIYLVISFLTLKKYQIKLKDHYSTLAELNLNWLFLLLITFVIMWSVDLVSFIAFEMNLLSMGMSQTLSLVSISINLLFATAIVVSGLRQQKVFSGIKEQKYAGSGLTKNQQQEYKSQVLELMEKKQLFLNPDLSLKELAGEVKLSPKYLSQVINSEFEITFFDFVNRFRVDAAKTAMHSSPDKTILEILYEVGYNSKSAFNKAFKNQTGITPTEFKKSLKKQSPFRNEVAI